MKYFSALIAFLGMLAIGGGCCTSGNIAIPQKPAEEFDLEIIKHAEESTVALIAGPAGDRRAYCSGVWIDDKHILTAAHCVEAAARMSFEISDEEEVYNPKGNLILFVNHSDLDKNLEIPQDVTSIGVVRKFDQKIDLSLIEVVTSTSKHDIAEIMIDENIVTGQGLHIVGHTAGIVWTYSRGYVSNSRMLEGPSGIIVKTLQASAPVWMGNSGGGAFDSQGHLVGICSWINLRAPNLSFFVHRDVVAKFLATS